MHGDTVFKAVKEELFLLRKEVKGFHDISLKIGCHIQCRHLIPALNAWAVVHNGRPHAQLPTNLLDNFDSQSTCAIDVLS